MPSPAVRRGIATLGNLAGMVLNGGGGQDSNEDWVAEAIVDMRTPEKGALWQVGQWL